MIEDQTGFELTVVTPAGIAWKERVESVVLQTTSGQIEVLRGHAAMVTVLEPGELRVRHHGAVESFAAGEGFAEVLGDRVRVFADLAENAETIAVDAVEVAKKRAEEALAGHARLSDEERAAAELVVKECNVKMALALNRQRRRDGMAAG